jgi:RHS repeat-associated protein
MSFDAASRLLTVSDGTNSAAYSYLANSPLVGQIAFAHSGATLMTATKTYDNLNRLTGIVNGNGTVPPVDSRGYAYNSANQRTGMTNLDGSYWVYTYDSLGQVTSGIKRWSDGTLVAGQQFDYTFDTIGNRFSTKAGGDTNTSGATLRTASYTNNLLNELVSRDAPGYADVMGLTLATNVVSVNGTNAYQRYEYFREQLGTNNTSAPQWMGINVTAPGQATVSGHEFIAKTPEIFAYDADGNLTNDGRWSYYWNGENRLVAMTNNASIPAAGEYALAFSYDYQGRRIQKLVCTNNGSWVPSYTNRFVYDGWNPIAILNSSFNILNSFMWGTDLSGSMQGAGGVGGLLAENIVSNGVHFVAYDANGNVADLVSATNGTVTATYEYGPFGEVIRATGPMAKLNPLRFSTKYQDDETGFLYYLYRYYIPFTGRWLSRDPIQEKGDRNLYGFVKENPISFVDLLGFKGGGWGDGWEPPPPLQNPVFPSDLNIPGLPQGPLIPPNPGTCSGYTCGTGTPTDPLPYPGMPGPGRGDSPAGGCAGAVYADALMWNDIVNSKMYKLALQDCKQQMGSRPPNCSCCHILICVAQDPSSPSLPANSAPPPYHVVQATGYLLQKTCDKVQAVSGPCFKAGCCPEKSCSKDYYEKM